MDIPHWFIHSSADGLVCFFFLAILNNTGMKNCMQVFVFTYVLHSLEYIPKCRIGSFDDSDFLRNCQTVFQSGCTILQSSQQWTRVSSLSTSSPTLVIVFFSLSIIVSITWYLIVVLIHISLVTKDAEHFKVFISHFSEKAMAPTPVLLPWKSHARRSLVGCSPWGHEESDTTERLHFHFSLSRIGEGNGNSLQCSYLENPRDGGAWWAAVYGVAQSRTRLKRLSSSSSSSRFYIVFGEMSIQVVCPFKNWVIFLSWLSCRSLYMF